MTTASRSLATALSRARSLAACSAELHHQLGRDPHPTGSSLPPAARRRNCGPNSDTAGQPICARITPNSFFKIARTFLMPARPAAAAPYNVGRPEKVNVAPRQRAATMSDPRRIPPSNITSACDPTASRIPGNASAEEGARSSWRPPWFDTITASAPSLTARRASSGCSMPFTRRWRGQVRRMSSSRSQVCIGAGH
jgi:hypothetical protein